MTDDSVSERNHGIIQIQPRTLELVINEIEPIASQPGTPALLRPPHPSQSSLSFDHFHSSPTADSPVHFTASRHEKGGASGPSFHSFLAFFLHSRLVHHHDQPRHEPRRSPNSRGQRAISKLQLRLSGCRFGLCAVVGRWTVVKFLLAGPALVWNPMPSHVWLFPSID